MANRVGCDATDRAFGGSCYPLLVTAVDDGAESNQGNAFLKLVAERTEAT